jgi:hypothetical protein
MKPNDSGFFINWSSAPKKTTHCCTHGFIEFHEDGTPVHHGVWERWIPIIKKNKWYGDFTIQEWNGKKWVDHTTSNNTNVFDYTRVLNPHLLSHEASAKYPFKDGKFKVREL